MNDDFSFQDYIKSKNIFKDLDDDDNNKILISLVDKYYRTNSYNEILKDCNIDIPLNIKRLIALKTFFENSDNEIEDYSHFFSKTDLEFIKEYNSFVLKIDKLECLNYEYRDELKKRKLKEEEKKKKEQELLKKQNEKKLKAENTKLKNEIKILKKALLKKK